MNNNIEHPEEKVLTLWIQIRWFLTLVLFIIGILKTNQIEQLYPIVVFIVIFLSISLLNVFYFLQIKISNNIFMVLQIILDIVFATLVVHITGGISSTFIWIYLIVIVTASLSKGKYIGFFTAIISILSLFLLMISYNNLWLMPVTINSDNLNTISQSIFLLSYSGLFIAIAMIQTFTITVLKNCSKKLKESEIIVSELEKNIIRNNEQLIQHKSKLKKYKEAVLISASISSIDHDINNPLTIISLSTRKIDKVAEKYQDKNLGKTGNQIKEAISKINKILLTIHELKKNELIQEQRNKMDKEK